MEAQMNAPAEKLVVDFKTLITDTEDLLKASAGSAGEKLAEARVRAQQALSNARTAIARAEAVALERAKAGAQVVDRSVQENPWAAIGIATGVGLLVGWMLGRR
jgi:ElaB/YqjD/DUF883 family membrane-anchored ribosome-binding protein